MSLAQYIRARVHLDWYLVDHDEEESESFRPTWKVTPFWNGELMPKFQATCDDHCRLLYHFSVGSKRFLLKVDEHPDFVQCEHEMEIWNSLDREDKRYFVPLMCGKAPEGEPPWVVCPLVPRLSINNDSSWRDRELVDNLVEKYKLADMRENSNWFMYNGRPLIVDYGLPDHRSSRRGGRNA